MWSFHCCGEIGKIVDCSPLKKFGMLTKLFFHIKVMLGAAPTPGHTVATLEHRYWGSQSMVNIYLHEVEGELERVVPGPDIRVKGDIGGYCYQFYMSGVKIAQVILVVLQVSQIH